MYVTLPSQFCEDPQQPVFSKRSKHRPWIPVPSGKYLFREGDEAKRLYQVKEGVLRLTRLTGDGRRQVIAFGFKGDIVGFPNGGMYHTDCQALTRAAVTSYNMSALESGDHPELQRTLLRAAFGEISAMQDHFMVLGRKSATEKVASFLCVLSEHIGTPIGQFTQFCLPMSREDIADFLGLTKETISRSLTQLRKRNIIAIQNVQTVVILKPDELLAFTEITD